MELLRYAWPPSHKNLLLASAFSLLTTLAPGIAYAQDAAPRSVCGINRILKAIKTVSGTYSEEARREGIEGKVELCVTVDADGKVVDVKVLRGPPELAQLSIDAAKQWRFEPPADAPATVTLEMHYSLTKPCPGGGAGSDAGEVKVDIGPGHIVDGETGDALKIVAAVNRAQPPYPENVRAERRRGQLYLSITVNGKGDVVDSKIVMPLDELLDQSALAAVRSWKFKVTPADGKPTVFPVTISFHIPCLDLPHNR
jgi:TonB family protein